MTAIPPSSYEGLIRGAVLIKYPKKVSKKAEDYLVAVDMTTLELSWTQLKKKKTKKRNYRCLNTMY
jgi:hypothetical protein